MCSEWVPARQLGLYWLMAEAIPLAAGIFLQKFLTLFCTFHDSMSKSKCSDKTSKSVCFWWHNQTTDDLTVLRLPPTLLVVWFEACDDILDMVTDGVVHRIVWSARITLETFLLLLHKVIHILEGQMVNYLHVVDQIGSGFTCRWLTMQ